MTEIEWFHKERGGRGPESTTGAVVSHLPGVKNAVGDAARSLAAAAWLQLLWHNRTGAAHIRVEGVPPHQTDTWVILEDADPGGEGKAGKNRQDRSAMSIEFGWTQTHAFGRKLPRPIQHDGLHVLGNAMNNAIRRHGGG